MTREERLLMKPDYTMVYHKNVGIAVQLVLKEIIDGNKYVFYGLEDVIVTESEVEDFFEIAQY